MHLLVLLCWLALVQAQTNLYFSPGICNYETKTCGLHYNNPNGLGVLPCILFPTVCAGTPFTNGWTLLINPCPATCTFANCSTVQTGTGCEEGNRIAFDWPYMRIPYSNITISSYYTGQNVLVRTSVDMFHNNLPEITWACSVFIFSGSAISISNFDIDLSLCAASAATQGNINTDLAYTPIIFITNATQNTLVANISAIATRTLVRIMPTPATTLVDITGFVAGMQLHAFTAHPIIQIPLHLVITMSTGPLVLQDPQYVTVIQSTYPACPTCYNIINITTLTGMHAMASSSAAATAVVAETTNKHMQRITMAIIGVAILLLLLCIALLAGICWMQCHRKTTKAIASVVENEHAQTIFTPTALNATTAKPTVKIRQRVHNS